MRTLRTAYISRIFQYHVLVMLWLICSGDVHVSALFRLVASNLQRIAVFGVSPPLHDVECVCDAQKPYFPSCKGGAPQNNNFLQVTKERVQAKKTCEVYILPAD